MGNPISKELFLARALSRFGDRYDYSAIVYKSYKSPIRLRCRQHPVREIVITPERHLQTTGGCKYCLREIRVRQLERGLAMPAASDRPELSPPPPPPQPSGRGGTAPLLSDLSSASVAWGTPSGG